MSNDDVRRLIRYRRDSITPHAQAIAAEQLAARVVASSIYQNSQHVAVYLAVGSELSVEPLIKRIWTDGKQCYLPVVGHQQSMMFVPYSINTDMRQNKFGIAEPVVCIESYPARKLELVLTPLVAFDKKCHRIGMGGGYYDRTFAFLAQPNQAMKPELKDSSKALREGNRTSTPFLMGVAHACQQVDVIHPEPWDVALDSIFTDLAEIKSDQSS